MEDQKDYYDDNFDVETEEENDDFDYYDLEDEDPEELNFEHF